MTIVHKVLLVVALLQPQLISAKTISSDEAATIAREFFSSKNYGDKGEVSCRSINRRVVNDRQTVAGPELQDATPAYYLFENVSDKGFVIVAADDSWQPIVGYSLSAKLGAENMPPQLVWFLESYERAMASGQAKAETDFVPVAVSPIMKTQWNQREPYNNLCDEYQIYGGGYVRCPTGCVATAIAQVMKVHDFPDRGRGKVSDYDLNNVYEWNKMIDNYEMTQYTDEQAAAVARLMRDIGAAVSMNYNVSESGAQEADILPSLFRHFNYSKDMQMLFRTYYSTSEWMAMIQDNLTKGWPVIYSGISSEGGHEFVIDGIDGDGFVHINWGWGGSADGYFDISALNPSEIGTGGGSGSYNRDQSMVINIHPGEADTDNSNYPGVLYIYNIRNGSETAEDGSCEGNMFYLCFDYANFTNREFLYVTNPAYVSWSLFDKDKKLIGNEIERGRLGTLRPKYYSTDGGLSIDLADVPDGEYYISFTPWTSDDYQYDIYFASDPYYPVRKHDGKLYFPDKVKGYDDCSIEFVSLEQLAPIYNREQSKSFRIKATFRNTGNVTISGGFEMYMLPDGCDEVLDELPSDAQLLGSIDINMIYQGSSSTGDFKARSNNSFVNLSAGKHRVAFVYNRELVKMDEPVYIEITDFPDEHPFVLTDRLLLNPDEVPNIRTWVGYELSYIAPWSWSWWYDGNQAIQFWARKRDSNEPEFLLREILASDMSTGSQASFILWDFADLTWKTPGTYDFYLKYKLNDEWVYIDSPNNRGMFTVVEDIPEYDLHLSSPMVINNGKPVTAGSYFPITFNVKTNTGFKLSGESIYPSMYFASSPDAETIGFGTDFVFGKDTLAPGEETSVYLKAYINTSDVDVENSRLMAIMSYSFIDGEYWKSALMNPGEYINSTYLTWDSGAGLSAIEADAERVRIEVENGACIISGLSTGDHVTIYSIDGRKCFGCRAEADNIQIALCQGVYIVNVHGADYSCSTKTIVK